MRVVLMSPEEAHARCAPGPGESQRLDRGMLVQHGDKTVTFLGCAFVADTPPTVYVPEDSYTIAHELRHIFDEYCLPK